MLGRPSIPVLIGSAVLLVACSSNLQASPTTAVSPSAAAPLTTTPRPPRTPVVPTPPAVELELGRTPRPTAEPTRWWGARPAQNQEAFTLMPGAAADVLGWAANGFEPYPSDARSYTYADYDTGAFVRMTMYREALIKDPDPHTADIARRALFDPGRQGWGAEVLLEPFRAELQRVLNGHPDTALTADSVTAALEAMAMPGMLVVKHVLPIANVLGDGQPGWIVDIGASYSSAVLVVAGHPGTYQVLKFESTWKPIAWNDYEVSVVDLNANGVPEVAIWDSYWGTGSSHFCDEYYTAYEWQGSGFVNLTPNVTSSANRDYGACVPFVFDPTAAGPVTITTGNVVYTDCPVDGDWARASLVLQRRFGWNGHYFDLTEETLLPYPDVAPDDTELAACALVWADQAGPEVPQVRALLARLLDTTDPTLIAAFTTRYGPAYHDFLAFKLGTWYAQIGDRAQARALLTDVRDRPRTPEYTMAGALADAFLQAYAARGAFAGCSAAAGLIDVADFPNTGESSWIVPYDATAMRTAWGFSGNGWSTGGLTLWAHPLLRQDRLNLCNPTTAFRLSVRAQAFTSTAQVADFLGRQGVPFEGLQEADVDGDGRRDWVLLAGTGVAETLEVWVLFGRPGGTEAAWVGGSAPADTHLPTTLASYTPTAASGRLTIYQWSLNVAVLRAVRLPDAVRVLDVLDRPELRTLTSLQVGFQIEPDPGQTEASILALRQSGLTQWAPEWIILGWDANAQSLAPVDRDGGAARAILAEAERLLFIEQDPAQAAARLQDLMGHQLPIALTPSARALPTFRPYALYLQGLAAERLGHSEEAIRAYWTLWNDYPTHPFSAIAQLKLTLGAEAP